MRYLITRHPGALHWAEQSGKSFDCQLAHLNDAGVVQAGDEVYGILPVNLAADVCARGARYFHITLELPPSQRGQELDAKQMQEFCADFVEFYVSRVNKNEEGLL